MMVHSLLSGAGGITASVAPGEIAQSLTQSCIGQLAVKSSTEGLRKHPSTGSRQCIDLASTVHPCSPPSDFFP